MVLWLTIELTNDVVCIPPRDLSLTTVVGGVGETYRYAQGMQVEGLLRVVQPSGFGKYRTSLV